jgi:hypothetical protein
VLSCMTYLEMSLSRSWSSTLPIVMLCMLMGVLVIALLPTGRGFTADPIEPLSPGNFASVRAVPRCDEEEGTQRSFQLSA